MAITDGSEPAPQALGELLKHCYAPVFDIIGDPAKAEPQDIENAFKAFEPRGQLVRMVQLFTGLMAYAELMPVAKARRKPGPKTTTAQKTVASTSPKAPKSGTNQDAPQFEQPPEFLPPKADQHPSPVSRRL